MLVFEFFVELDRDKWNDEWDQNDYDKWDDWNTSDVEQYSERAKDGEALQNDGENEREYEAWVPDF